MKSIYELKPTKTDFTDDNYKYQDDLTSKLDEISTDFNQEIINEIVLWKVNRYAKLDIECINLINQINKDSQTLDTKITEEILTLMLHTQGIRLPMASTILRFKNPNIYQILDQRVYRIIYGRQLKLSTSVQRSIAQYLDYLIELKKVCSLYKIHFNKSDRVLYEYDKVSNLEKIKY